MYKELLQSWGDETVNKLIANYIRMGLRAFGEFEAGTVAEAQERSMQITAPFHAIMMNEGRKPGKFPPPDEILRWVRLGKIQRNSDISDESLAYLIGRKIALHGIKVPNKHNLGNVITDVLTDGTLDSLEEDLAKLYQKELRNQIIKAYEIF